MAVGPDDYKDALRKFASGVTVVTVAAEGRVHGMTATSFASVSLEPPLVLVSLEKSSRTRAMVVSSMAFAVNVLRESQEDIAHAFARPGRKSFDGLTTHAGKSGAPLLDDAIAWIECDVHSVVDGGDHDVVLGEVVACTAYPGAPLLYYNRDYRAFSGRSPGPTTTT
jgi:flavin reductase (DIM6/NTAB) family NADH-FMN oxidoreductase RutF